MKNPLSFLTRQNLEKSIGALQSRFPIASIIVLIMTGLLAYVINTESESTTLIRVILSLVVTFFLSIGVSLFIEGEKQKTSLAWHSLPIIYGIIFFFTINPITNGWMLDSITYFILHLVGFIALLFFAPYCHGILYRRDRGIEYTNYFSRTAWSLFMACIVGGALVALGFIAISSVMALFDLSSAIQKYKVYENWAIFSLSLIAPLYCLVHLPKIAEINKNIYEINRFFSFLIRFIAVPFIVIYFVILYAYSVKVLMNFQDWPKGMISWMVVGFSTFGYLTYIFSKPYEKENVILAAVRRVFPYVVPAQILMLAYSIYLRIAQYDLTMNRYFVVIFGCWLAIISVYYILSQRKSLTMITVSLAAISLFVSVGPWSVYQFPISRQHTRLVKNLEVAGILKDGVISKKPAPLEADLENTIYSEIQYICDFSECETIKKLFVKELTGKEEEYAKKWTAETYNAGKKYPGMSNWEIVNEVTTALGIAYRPLGIEYTNKYISLGGKFSYDETTIFPLDTT